MERSEKERALIAEAERIFPTQTRCLTFDPELNFVVGKAQGSHLWDVSGNEYIDYLLGSGPHVLGHAHPAVLEALRTVPEGGTSHLIVNEHAVAFVVAKTTVVALGSLLLWKRRYHPLAVTTLDSLVRG